MRSTSWARLVCSLILALTLGIQPAALLAQTKTLKPGFNFFSKDQDVELGREAAAQVDREMPIVKNAEMDAWLQKLAEPLIAQPEAGGYPYQFKWVNDENINAFALPGGPVYMNTGLLSHADNEAQVVGVLAHEISHVALRHGTNQASKANLFSIPAMIGSAMLGDRSILGQLGQLGIGLGLNSVLLKYSRGAETQADQLGSLLMHRAGYNPIEMANFFEKLEAISGNQSGVASWFSSHPNPGNRVENVQKEILTFDRRDYQRNTNQFDKIKSLATKLPPPPKTPAGGAAGQGGSATLPAVSDMEAPSSRTKSHQASTFTVSYPDNWQVSEGQDGGVTVLPAYGAVSTGNNGSALGYGAIIRQHTSNGSQRIDEIAASVAQDVVKNNPGMQVTEEARRIMVNNRRAMLYMMSGTSPFEGQKEVVVLAVVERGQNDAVSTVFVAPERDYSRFEPTFKNILASLQMR